MKKLLIISNNVLSYTNNNGKTVLSFIEGIDEVEVAQLYLSGEKPKINEYKYYRISDKDVIRGMFNSRKRGYPIAEFVSDNRSDDFSIKKRVGRNDSTLLARDLLWWNKWKSQQLITWLDEFSPDAVFFVAGDALFPYSICDFVVKKYKARLTVYVTDDYIMRRSHENLLHAIRRKSIKKSLDRILDTADCFYTVSDTMKEAYSKVLGKSSHVAVNMSEDLIDSSFSKKEPEIILTYAGSFYYKRSTVIGKLAQVIQKYNSNADVVPAKLLLYSNSEPTDIVKKEVCIPEVSEYCGSLGKNELIERLNTSDILVFVESFDIEQIEKVRYSLSTKVPEYMSIGKPILAIGPADVGSMVYLGDVAFCITDEKSIDSVIDFLKNEELRTRYGILAREKYNRNHNKVMLQQEFLANVFGTAEKNENS